MKQNIQIFCRHCRSENLRKNGKSENGTQRYYCNKCKGSFQLEYRYNAWKEGVKEQIDTQTLNSSGIRDISRNLKIAQKTVIEHLKKKKPKKLNPYFLDIKEYEKLKKLDIVLCVSTEWDEFWSYVYKKSQQRWTWYLLERNSGVIIAWENGRRTDNVLKKLLNHVKNTPINICHTDNWAAYSKLFPLEFEHIIGKDNTWKIERKNLNFRTHIKRLNRKTICFSKDEQIHDNVIGMYIEKYYYKYGKFSDAIKAEQRN